MGMDLAIDALIASKSIREWGALAHALGMKVGEYVDAVILEFIMNDYNRGIITATECATLREEWGV